MVKKIRSIVTEKEAILFNGVNYEECFHFIGDAVETSRNLMDRIIRIHTLEGTMIANKGDWIIKGLRGEFYPCKPDIFKKSYEIIKQPGENGATAIDAIY